MKSIKKLAAGGAFTSAPRTFVSQPTVAPPPTSTVTPQPPQAGSYGSNYKGLNKKIINYLNSQQVGGAPRFGYDPVSKSFRTMEGAGPPVFVNMNQMLKAARGWGRVQRSGGQFNPNFKEGGKVKSSSASKRGDGIATKGKTRGRFV
jgi:hypothetical protein